MVKILFIVGWLSYFTKHTKHTRQNGGFVTARFYRGELSRRIIVENRTVQPELVCSHRANAELPIAMSYKPGVFEGVWQRFRFK